MSLRIAPPVNHATSTKTVPSAPSAPGLPDTLRNTLNKNTPAASSSPSTLPHLEASQTSSSHPLEARLAAWRSTQHELKMTGLRRTFGIAEPVRRGMELQIVRGGEWRPSVLGGSEGVHGDVLEGRDWCVDWEDVYNQKDGVNVSEEAGGMQGEVEAKVRMGAL